jgi:glycosyltransferase involved in cell wall biosynthesis
VYTVLSVGDRRWRYDRRWAGRWFVHSCPICGRPDPHQGVIVHIVMISDWASRGGAAIAALRLATGLLEAGDRVTRLVAYPARQPDAWPSIRITAPIFPLRRMVRRGLPLGPRTLLDRIAIPAAMAAFAQALNRLRPDLIHLHNLHGGIGAGWSPALLSVAAGVAPVVWTLHDMWPLTGRCTYSGGCIRFQTSCDAACPTAHAYPALPPHLVGPAFEARRIALAGAPRAVAVAPSQWMADQARSGIWAGREVVHIPNGIPLDIYTPHERSVARRALGLPTDGLQVLVAMPHLADERKGAALLRTLGSAAVEMLPPFTLITMGAGSPPPLEKLNVRQFGYVADEHRRALVYAAADLLLHLAPEDNLPNTVIEALACGTPCAALPVGGLSELVQPGVTGWLAAAATAPALETALAAALNAIAAGQTLRATCRSAAAMHYDLGLMTRRYRELYGRL